MNNIDCRKLIESILENEILKIETLNDNLYVSIYPNLILRSLSILNSNPELSFEALTDCFAMDYLKLRGVFTIFYQLQSYKIDKTIFIKIDISEEDNVQSVSMLYPNANWYEREIFDMFGIKFLDHPDLRRILSHYTDGQFLLRKS